MSQLTELPMLLPPAPPERRRRWPRRVLTIIEVVIVLLALVVIVSHKVNSRNAVSLPPVVPLVTGPALPLDMVAFDSNRSGSYQLYVERTDGTGLRQITHVKGKDCW